MPHSLFHFGDIPNPLRAEVFVYFYWFSRFEFALKENGYIRKGPFGVASSDWKKYVDEFAKEYEPCAAAIRLLEKPPLCQMYEKSGYSWKTVDLSREKSELGRVLLVLRAIRNNLFHGGKHGQDDWDEPDRNLFLLQNGKLVLDRVAQLSQIYGDYLRIY